MCVCMFKCVCVCVSVCCWRESPFGEGRLGSSDGVQAETGSGDSLFSASLRFPLLRERLKVLRGRLVRFWCC